jgi:diacylglycerol kinase family enzyme
MKKLLFLINPVSGASPGQTVAKHIQTALADRMYPWQYDTIFTNGNTVEQARELSPDYESVIAVGGDGTFGQIVQAVSGMENPPGISIIPYGVGNDLARSIGVYSIFEEKGVRGVLHMILAGKTRRMDVLRLDGETLFASYFGLGNDALVSNEFNRLRPRNLLTFMGTRKFVSTGLYTILILENLSYQFPFPIELAYRDHKGEEKTVPVPEGSHGILITNVGIYAGGAMISSRCNLCDGEFEVTVIEKIRTWWLMHLSRFFKKPLDVLCPGITQFQTSELAIRTQGQTFCQLDGEKITLAPGETRVSVNHQIEVIVP